MAFALEVVRVTRDEYPELWNEDFEARIHTMLEEAVDCEMQFAEDLLGGGIPGLSLTDMRQYLEFVADQRLKNLDLEPRFGSKNPFSFMELQDVQELSNFFERRVSAYQVSVSGEVAFDEAF
jgi:ribonucleoside-diphosphate reductase beta chain